jgi:antitoxin component YwqK of YwqJK toxin-antitoxin module
MKKATLSFFLCILLARCSNYNDRNLSYYDNGKVKTDSTIINGVANGPVKLYTELGTLKMEGFLKNGKRDSVFKFYYNSGSIESIVLYKNGRPNGSSQEYFEDGKLKSEGGYSHGKQDGIVKSYFENGNLKAVGRYVNDTLVGLYKIYYPNKQLQQISFSEQGHVAFLRNYDSLGNFVNERRFIRPVKYDSIINLGENFSMSVRLTGTFDDVAVHAAVGTAMKGVEIKQYNEVSFESNGVINYSFKPSKKGNYICKIWFDVRDKNNGTIFNTYRYNIYYVVR